MAEKKKSVETKKVAEPKAAAAKTKVVETKVDQGVRPTESRDWNIGSLFWGLLLVTAGVLLLLGNFGYVQLDWMNVLRLWPLAIIAAGVSILAVKSTLWKLVSVVLLVLTLVAFSMLATGALGSASPEFRRFESNVQPVGSDVKKADIKVSGGASKFRVTTANLDVAAKASLESSIARLEENASVRGDTQYVELSSRNNRGHWMMGSFKNDWDVVLDEDRPMRLVIDSGASDVDIDVSRGMIESLLLDAGASNSRLTVGDKVANLKIEIDAGASKTVIRLPKSSGVKLKMDGGLNSKNLADLREVSKDNYESDNYDTAKNKIEIDADIGVADLTIERY